MSFQASVGKTLRVDKGSQGSGGGTGGGDNIITESSAYILTESGDHILTE